MTENAGAEPNVGVNQNSGAESLVDSLVETAGAWDQGVVVLAEDWCSLREDGVDLMMDGVALMIALSKCCLRMIRDPENEEFDTTEKLMDELKQNWLMELEEFRNKLAAIKNWNHDHAPLIQIPNVAPDIGAAVVIAAPGEQRIVEPNDEEQPDNL